MIEEQDFHTWLAWIHRSCSQFQRN